ASRSLAMPSAVQPRPELESNLQLPSNHYEDKIERSTQKEIKRNTRHRRPARIREEKSLMTNKRILNER
ncbi:MAG: hypothetical protein C4287_22980, partial [Leptolyngbya sp. ERB_1_2]